MQEQLAGLVQRNLKLTQVTLVRHWQIRLLLMFREYRNGPFRLVEPTKLRHMVRKVAMTVAKAHTFLENLNSIQGIS